ncbi:MAG: hypothetical protein COA92_00270 [Sulfurovum sp.]|nr:MAG: hypothetical protein COA92_00270 [Sulfurovum sp.]
MNDHNLDDLIIDTIEPKNSKTKSFLTIIALAIVVLIVAIILTKIILKDPNEKLAIDEENNTEMISPELTLQNIIKKDIVGEKLSLDTPVKPKFGPVAGSETVKSTKLSTTPAQKPAIEIKPETIQITTQPANDEAELKHKAQEKKLAEEKRQKELAQQKEQELVAKRKAEEKAKKEAKLKKENAAKQTKNTYYIQVGSFTQSPSSRFLSVIKKSGFNYKITPTSSSGTKKLLIGPYKSRREVDTALVRVRDRINKSAFVVKK